MQDPTHLRHAHTPGQWIYTLWTPIYDLVFKPVFARARQRAISLLALQPGENLLVPGIGTGLDLPHLPTTVSITGIDLHAGMLDKSRVKSTGHRVELLQMDAQNLDFPDESFDAVLLNLVVSVVPDGALAFQECWRVLRPGGRVVIFDKFLPEEARLTLPRRLIGRIMTLCGTDPNRRLSEIIGGIPDLIVEHDEPSLLRGQYRILVLRKG
jgi:phosphatidylethanolamine/phosphatidyl-N-methylethanolamine N-methyltransferase